MHRRRARLAMGPCLLLFLAGCAAPDGPPGELGGPDFRVAAASFDGLGARPVLVTLGADCGLCPQGGPWAEPAVFHGIVLLEDLRAVRFELNLEGGDAGRLQLHPGLAFNATALREALGVFPAMGNNSAYVTRMVTGRVAADARALLAHLNATWEQPGPVFPCADCASTAFWYAPTPDDRRAAEAAPPHPGRPLIAFSEYVAAIDAALAANGTALRGPSGSSAPSVGPVPGCFSQRATELYEVIRDQAAWVRRWQESCQANSEGGAPPQTPPAPAVDWERQAIIAAFWGQKSSGGYTIELRRVTQTATHDVFEVVRTAPGPGCGTAAVITHPGLFYAERELKAVEFRFTDRVHTCT